MMMTFSSTLEHIIASVPASQHTPRETSCRTSDGKLCMLCLGDRISYDEELETKKRALDTYWRTLFPTVPLRPFVVSPLGRRYRTITKRKVFARRGNHSLGLIAPDDEGVLRPTAVRDCLIEPAMHNSIYVAVEQMIQSGSFGQLADVLRYVVVKGNYREQTVILSLTHQRQKDRKPLTALSKKLTAAFPSIVGAFSYLDRSDGTHYLGEEDNRTMRRIFGKQEIYQNVDGRTFLFPPLSFSQINQSLLGQLVQEVSSASGLDGSGRLIDLYCGYGLFSLCLAGRAKETIGIERSAASIAAARANASRQGVAHARFVQADIRAEKLEKILPRNMSDDVVILDPPRGGTRPGVIEIVAARKPGRAIHLFCNSDIMPREVERWQNAGFSPRWARPFDMFPGTPVVEFLIVFECGENS